MSEDMLDTKRLLLKTAVGIVLLIGLLVLVSLGFRDPLLEFSKAFVQQFGVYGVGAAFWFLDATSFPFPHDFFLAFGLLGGLQFTPIAVVASIGSITGGCAGYLAGVHLSRTELFGRLMKKRYERAIQLVGRYGALGVAVAALSPLPYSPACWASGAFRMPFKTFFGVSLLRIPRVLFYLWLIELGVVNVF